MTPYSYLRRNKKLFSCSFQNCRGYVASARAIVGCAQRIAARVRAEIPELRVLGKPPGPCVTFTAAVVPGVGESVDALAVGDATSKRGWHLNGLSSPAAVHIACTVSHTSHVLVMPLLSLLCASYSIFACFSKISMCYRIEPRYWV